MNRKKQIIAGVLTGVLTVAAAMPVMSAARKSCVALGADLKTEERSTVLKLLNVTEDDVAEGNIPKERYERIYKISIELAAGFEKLLADSEGGLK